MQKKKNNASHRQSMKHHTGSAKYFCLENALKKLLNIFKIQSFRLIMENNFMTMQ